VQEAVSQSGIKEGLALVNPMHITASVFINDDEPGLHHDFELWLEKLAPEKPYSQYRHNGFEDNADAHLKRTVMGRESVVAITNGKLDFGTWEQLFYFEFDGKREKRVLVKIMANDNSQDLNFCAKNRLHFQPVFYIEYRRKFPA
jgi:secondary thiamine-phosphate synthase enzyme